MLVFPLLMCVRYIFFCDVKQPKQNGHTRCLVTDMPHRIAFYSRFPFSLFLSSLFFLFFSPIWFLDFWLSVELNPEPELDPFEQRGMLQFGSLSLRGWFFLLVRTPEQKRRFGLSDVADAIGVYGVVYVWCMVCMVCMWCLCVVVCNVLCVVLSVYLFVLGIHAKSREKALTMHISQLTLSKHTVRKNAIIKEWEG